MEKYSRLNTMPDGTAMYHSNNGTIRLFNPKSQSSDTTTCHGIDKTEKEKSVVKRNTGNRMYDLIAGSYCAFVGLFLPLFVAKFNEYYQGEIFNRFFDPSSLLSHLVQEAGLPEPFNYIGGGLLAGLSYSTVPFSVFSIHAGAKFLKRATKSGCDEAVPEKKILPQEKSATPTKIIEVPHRPAVLHPTSVPPQQRSEASMKIEPSKENIPQGEIIGWGPQQPAGGNAFIVDPIRAQPKNA